MLEFFLSLLIMLCLLFGLRLRYLPFAGIMTQEQKQLLRTCNLVIIPVYLILVWWAVFTNGLSLTLVKILGVTFAIITAAVQLLVVRKRVCEQLFVFGVAICINYMMLAIPSFLFHLLGPNSSQLRPYLVVGSYLVLLAVTFIPMRRMLSDTVMPFLQMESGSYWTLIWFMPLFLFISMMLLYPGETRVDTPAPLISGVITALLIILMCRTIVADSRRMIQQKQVEEQLKDQQIYFAELKASVEEARRSRHDLKHKLNAINYYLESGDLESLQQYCRALTEETTRQTASKNHGLDLVEGVILRYSRQAEQEHIRFVCTERHNVPWITDLDLCVLLGNSLDNAFEACRQAAEDRRIAIALRGDERTLNILVQNTFDGELDIRDDVLYSRKGENRLGIGMGSIREICEKYNGSAEYFADSHLFSINMILKCE